MTGTPFRDVIAGNDLLLLRKKCFSEKKILFCFPPFLRRVNYAQHSRLDYPNRIFASQAFTGLKGVPDINSYDNHDWVN